MKLKPILFLSVSITTALVLAACSTTNPQMQQAGQTMVTNGQAMEANGQQMPDAGMAMQNNAQQMMDGADLMQTQGRVMRDAGDKMIAALIVFYSPAFSRRDSSWRRSSPSPSAQC